MVRVSETAGSQTVIWEEPINEEVEIVKQYVHLDPASPSRNKSVQSLSGAKDGEKGFEYREPKAQSQDGGRHRQDSETGDRH